MKANKAEASEASAGSKGLRERSRNYPAITLEDAVQSLMQFHAKAGRNAVNPIVAVSMWGYKAMSGSAATKLAAMTGHYQLLARDQNGSIRVSELGLKIAVPVNQAERPLALKEAALLPKVFKEIKDEYHGLAEETLKAQLQRSKGFSEDGAEKAASIYFANSIFAKLDEADLEQVESGQMTSVVSAVQGFGQRVPPSTGGLPAGSAAKVYPFAISDEVTFVVQVVADRRPTRDEMEEFSKAFERFRARYKDPE